MARCGGRQGEQESTRVHSIQLIRRPQGDPAVSGEPMDDDAQQAVEAFIAEVRHWREVAGLAQKALARLVGYSSSYVSKVEKGSIIASTEFADNAHRATRSGTSIVR